MSLFTSDKPAAVQARDLRTYSHFDLLLSIFLVVLLISNLVGQKLCQIGPFVVSGANLLFPITYIFGDVFTEVYGYAASRRAIWLGFLANGLLAIMGLITVWLPPAPGWPHHRSAPRSRSWSSRCVRPMCFRTGRNTLSFRWSIR